MSSDKDTLYAKVIANNIKLFRKINGYTQEQLAEKADLSISHIRNLENAVSQNPGYISLVKIGAALGIPVEFFTKGTGVRAFEVYNSLGFVQEAINLPDDEFKQLEKLCFSIYRFIVEQRNDEKE